MDALQMTIWAVTAILLGGLAWAFFKNDGLAIRLGALGLFGVFYVAMVLWAPTDATWADVTIMAVIVIALGSRMKKPADDTKPSDPDAEQGGPSDD